MLAFVKAYKLQYEFTCSPDSDEGFDDHDDEYNYNYYFKIRKLMILSK